MDLYVGFDSAWTDNVRAPGAICAVGMEGRKAVSYYPPRLVSFDVALSFIRDIAPSDGVTIVAIDQPTIVPNSTGMRPVERAASSLISWLGGGVQPSNKHRVGMFCEAAPIWRFLASLDAQEDPEQSRSALNGRFVMEVFPALALASLSDRFYGRLCAPKYNPARKKTFRATDWILVSQIAAEKAHQVGCSDLAIWCENIGTQIEVKKSDQDMLDAALCVIIAMGWRLESRDRSILLGDLETGYMVTPISRRCESDCAYLRSNTKYILMVYFRYSIYSARRCSCYGDKLFKSAAIIWFYKS
jgi:predicted RNase H-like nuclease